MRAILTDEMQGETVALRPQEGKSVTQHGSRNAREKFDTPEQVFLGASPEFGRGGLVIASCSCGSYMARKVIEHYRIQLQKKSGESDPVEMLDVDSRFTDSETHVRLEQHVSGRDVFLFQALCDPVSGTKIDENYMAFLIAARAFREHGARHITAVLPYLAYARQDKPTKFRREPTTARLMADLSIQAGIDQLIAWHPHSGQLYGFYGTTPIHFLEPISLFVDLCSRLKSRNDVIAVAPDAGASKLVTHFSRSLDVSSAVASKLRTGPQEIKITQIMGDFRKKRTAIVLDDIVSSGGTVFELIRQLVEGGKVEEVILCASHNLCMQEAYDRFVTLHERFKLVEIMVTDSIPQTDQFGSLPFFSVHSLSGILSKVIRCLHHERSISEIFGHSLE